MKFEASIVGAKVSEKGSKSDFMTFKDPEKYKDMNQEERKELTQKMMSQTKLALGTSGFGG
jgi:hypothetical protein